MTDDRGPLALLQSLGAAGVTHFNGTLEQHLRGTEALLRSFGAREAVCRAGLFHAVYGTPGFDQPVAGPGDRQRIAAVIGREAERLAYLYGACDRDVHYPRIGSPDELRFPDRFSRMEYPIDAATLADLCEITVANELEVLALRPQFRRRWRGARQELFGRMTGRASAAALGAFRRSSAGVAPGSLS